MDTLGFEPRAFRMRSGCDATTPCALVHCATLSHYLQHDAGARRWPASHTVHQNDMAAPASMQALNAIHLARIELATFSV